MAKDKIKIVSAKEYKEKQKGPIELQNGVWFEVEQIPLDLHMEIFEELSKSFDQYNKNALFYYVGRDEKLQRAYAILALPLFVKNPKVTAEEEKDSIGVNNMGLMDMKTLVTASLTGVNSPKVAMASFRGRESDIDKIMDELSSLQSETE